MTPQTHRSRNRSPGRTVLIAISCAALTLGACSHQVEVSTFSSPTGTLAGKQTFRIMNAPEYRGTEPLSAQDPMLTNSITYSALRQEIRSAMEAKGYRYAPDRADLDVAYYATAAPKLDIRTFNYGYTWRGWPREYTEAYQYEQGTVLIDLVDPANHELLWRGRGVAEVSTNPDHYTQELRKAADAIVKKLPVSPARA